MNSRVTRFWHLVQFQLAAALHQRVAWVLTGAALAVVLAGSALRAFNFGAAEPRFFASVAQMALFVTGTLLAAALGPALLGDGIRTRTAHLLFARGVRRAEWVAATIAALWLVLGWLVVLVTAALAWLLVRHGHGEWWKIAVRQLAGGAAAMLVVSAGAVFFGAIFERATAAAVATVALALAGQLAPIIARLEAGSRGLELWGWRVLDWLVPNFSALEHASAWAPLGYLCGYTAVYFAAAALVFSRREL